MTNKSRPSQTSRSELEEDRNNWKRIAIAYIIIGFLFSVFWIISLIQNYHLQSENSQLNQTIYFYQERYGDLYNVPYPVSLDSVIVRGVTMKCNGLLYSNQTYTQEDLIKMCEILK